MAEITKGAAICWREWSANLGATITLGSVTPYVRSGHTCLGSPTVTVDSAFPLSNMIDRRLAKVARLICTPAQDTGSGGNNRWYYANFQIKVAFSYAPPVALAQPYPFNCMGLLNVDARYPSIEPNVEMNGGFPGGYYAGWNSDTYSALNWTGTNNFHKFIGDGTTYPTVRAFPQISGYSYPNGTVLFFDRAAVGSAIFTFGPSLQNTYAGESANPGTCYITIGRLWMGDAVILPPGIDAFWKLMPVDTSIIRRSRGQQIYVDAMQRLRSLDFAVSVQADMNIGQTPAGSPFDPGWGSGSANQHPPGLLMMGLEAGVGGEVYVQPSLSWNAGSSNWWAYASRIYGTIAPPGIVLDDQSGGYSKTSGNIIESR